MKFAELTQVALLGTERQAISVAQAATSLGQLESQVDANRRERALLSLAALNVVHEHIGARPARDSAPSLQRCAAEHRTRVSDHAGSMLRWMITGEFTDLLPEWLALAAKAELIALPEVLPGLLKTGASNGELREAIVPVLGERGRWLAAQNPEWAWVGGAASEGEDVWHVGERPARLLFLGRLRRTNLARARELLAATWKEEAPEDRATFLATFETGLALEDEPFLEAALDDKRKEVRRAAVELLGRLPDSALVKRQVERVRPLIKFVPGEARSVLKLKKAKPAAIEITLPTECSKAMQRDGVEPNPQQGFGEKAWWLIQMLESVPLNLWVTEWNSTPGEILAVSQQGEWKKELFEAWTGAAIRQRNAGWAEALFDMALVGNQINKVAGLLAAMSPERREAKLAGLFSSGDKKTRELLGALIVQCRHEWSPLFSRTVLAFMRAETAQESVDWQLRNIFKDFAIRLAPEALADAANGWPTDSKGWEFWSKGVDEFLAVTQFRSDLHAALKPEH